MSKEKQAPKSQKKVTRTQTYEIKCEHLDDGTIQVTRVNDGFHPYELLGYLEQTQLEIIDQLRGIIKPSKTIRKVIK